MKIILHKKFVKDYRKLTPRQQRQFKQRRNLFLENPAASRLHGHPLKGKYTGYRSFNVSGDLRTAYRQIDPDAVVFVRITTHSELYG